MLNAVVTVRRSLGRLRCHGDSGVTSVEYALLAGLIALVIVGAVSLLGNQVNSIFSQMASAF